MLRIAPSGRGPAGSCRCARLPAFRPTQQEVGSRPFRQALGAARDGLKALALAGGAMAGAGAAEALTHSSGAASPDMATQVAFFEKRKFWAPVTHQACFLTTKITKPGAPSPADTAGVLSPLKAGPKAWAAVGICYLV